MEAGLRKSGEEGCAKVKQEKRVESGNGDEEGCNQETALKVGNYGRRDYEEDDNYLKLTPPDKSNQDNELESAKAEMGEVREENLRLRMYISRVTKQYQSLQMQFYDVVQQETNEQHSINTETSAHTNEDTEERHELVSLSLGRTSSSDMKKDEKPRKDHEDHDAAGKEGLALGLQYSKFETPKTGPPTHQEITRVLNSSPDENSEDQVNCREVGGNWSPGKALKTARSGDDDEVSLQNPAKKARVSVRVRCDTPTMNDGCQWRKYGQKISKGNPCPRAYYRCTVAPSCPVRKQVQRCAQDMSILITTYEGTHNHPLSISATAMASTTSAAASMLLSGSSTSQTGISSSVGNTTATSVPDFRGPNFSLSDLYSKSKQFYLANSSISSSTSYPTITLDLTSTSSSSHFNKFSSNFLSSTAPPRYSSTNLNFSSLESNPLPLSWSNGVLSYGNSQPYNNNQLGSLNFGARQPQENFYQSFAQKSANSSPPQLPFTTPFSTDTIAAITSDPSFQSALAAALSSIMAPATNGSSIGGIPGYQVPSTIAKGNKCVSTNVTFGQPPLTFSTSSKSKSTSPHDMDHSYD